MRKRNMRKQKLSAEFIKREAKRVTGETSMESQVLLASAVVGPNLKRISKFLGINRRKSGGHLSVISQNLRKSRIWHGGKVAGGGWFEKDGGLEFVLDCAVAHGFIERKPV